MNISRFAFPTTIHFGAGARTLVAEHLRMQGVERPLVVTDRGIAPLPLLAKFLDGLKGLDVAVYSAIWGNPVKSQVEKGVAAYRAHRADAVIGLGGGAGPGVAQAIAPRAGELGGGLTNARRDPPAWPAERERPSLPAPPATSGARPGER